MYFYIYLFIDHTLG